MIRRLFWIRKTAYLLQAGDFAESAKWERVGPKWWGRPVLRIGKVRILRLAYINKVE